MSGTSAHKAEHIYWTERKVTAAQRADRNGHWGWVVWLTGLSGSGKSTIATELERELFQLGKQVCVLNGHRAAVIWLTGLPGSGKSTIGSLLERELFASGVQTMLLDGDHVRHGLSGDLGFSERDRSENIRRVGEVARLFAEAGMICVTAFISPYRADRQLARAMAPAGKFIEVYLNAPLEICEQRDWKGLYAKARAGEIKDFTGISAPYEPPLQADLQLPTHQWGVEKCVAAILARVGQ